MHIRVPTVRRKMSKSVESEEEDDFMILLRLTIILIGIIELAHFLGSLESDSNRWLAE